ncbi:apolipoprotein D and lipocalin family protein [Rhizobium sp. NFR07]|uniref:lipocalin family protein n=1 Tax=Rhizobium sp. NFR07 TaxID=1566262 RepID=UPI0008E02321|nr:lipocalin family protein [Rhizobium sp. NFR07]SFB62915.1 apolipoprotein D and lipocalin family protein [Rhizobium sp. NFR07]
MQHFWKCLLRALCLAAALAPQATTAAEPDVVKVGNDHYRGTWLEIGRRPMWLTDGCVAGYSTYRRGKTPDQVLVEDGCRVGSPNGRLKTVRGIGRITDFNGDRAKMRVRYPLLITFNYWVLYKSPDKTWFISADPHMTNLWIYARTVPSKAKLKTMVRKARELGYDVQKLEFPEL